MPETLHEGSEGRCNSVAFLAVLDCLVVDKIGLHSRFNLFKL
jgi:hypothetical protein